VLAEFGSAVEAVRCAVEVQEALKTRNDSLPENRRMLFRVGVNLGDVVVKDEDLLGDGVNVAARLETMAEPGGICISSSVYDQITGKLDLGFLDIGEQSLKNISRPIRVYRVSGSARTQAAILAGSQASGMGRRRVLPWLALTIVIASIAAAAMFWQNGRWVAGPAAMPPSPAAGVDAAAMARAEVESELRRQRTEAEAEALKRQAAMELDRARAEAEAGRAALVNAEKEAAKIRAGAEAAAARSAGNATASRPMPAGQQPDTGNRAKMPGSAVANAPAEAATSVPVGSGTGFDGVWDVKVDCPDHPDGALGYTYVFVAAVKDGLLRGEYGTLGNPASLLLQGRIRPDGSARLDAKGHTGNPKYAVKGVQSATPYQYQVEAQFEGAHGSGRRTQTRSCILTFAKQ
jgi:hypothetical protein